MSCIDKEKLYNNPINQFHIWFCEALSSSELLPNAAAFSTIGEGGFPISRIVLIKAYDDNGFLFFSDSTSDKIEHIKKNSKASFLFYWQSMERQVKVSGVVSELSNKESFRYFLKRGSCAGCWIEDKTKILKIRYVLENKLKDVLQFNKSDILWRGYMLKPVFFEFWQGCEESLYENAVYVYGKNGWDIKNSNYKRNI